MACEHIYTVTLSMKGMQNMEALVVLYLGVLCSSLRHICYLLFAGYCMYFEPTKWDPMGCLT